MFGQIFDPENALWRIVSRMVDWVGLSLLWIALSLFIAPAGGASAALYFTVVRAFRQGERQPFGLYFRELKGNFKRGVLAMLICLPASVLLAYGYCVVRANAAVSAMGTVMYVAYHVALIIPGGIMCYLFALMGRFEMKLKDLFRTAAFLALRHLPTTVILVLMNVQLIVFTLEHWWPILITPVASCLLSSLFLEKIFIRYLSAEEREELMGEEADEKD